MNKVNLAELKWIDKLIYLLLEYCRKHYWFKENDDIVIDTDSVQFHLYLDGKRLFWINVEKVIYKDFWFIKNLVDDDNLKWIDKFWWWDMMLWMPEKQDYYIMYLSVAPNPIETLIHLLK